MPLPSFRSVVLLALLAIVAAACGQTGSPVANPSAATLSPGATGSPSVQESRQALVVEVVNLVEARESEEGAWATAVPEQ